MTYILLVFAILIRAIQPLQPLLGISRNDARIELIRVALTYISEVSQSTFIVNSWTENIGPVPFSQTRQEWAGLQNLYHTGNHSTCRPQLSNVGRV